MPDPDFRPSDYSSGGFFYAEIFSDQNRRDPEPQKTFLDNYTGYTEGRSDCVGYTERRSDYGIDTIVRCIEGSSDMDAPGIEPGSASVSCECYETSNPIRALGIQV